jgi:hypothetical protein
MKHILSLVFFATIIALSSCSIEKRVYQSGYYISGRHANQDDIKVEKGIIPIVFEKRMSIEGNSEPASVVSVIDSTSTKTPEYIDSIIEDNNSPNTNYIKQTSTISNSDSIPEDGKILLARYEKNHKAKDKISQIATYPLAILSIGFFTVLILFIPWLYGAIQNDEWLIKFLLFCLLMFIFTIPLLIAYFILSRITKKQRRKLRRMGLVK